MKYIFIGLPKGNWAPNAAMSKGVPEDLAKLLKSLKGDPRRIAVRFFNSKEALSDDQLTTDIILCPDMVRYNSVPMAEMADVIGHLLDGKQPDFPSEDVTGKHLFICAHGVRDMCCAKFGFGTIRGLRNSMGETPTNNEWHLWEVTHLVGDRFAGTAVQFPEGHMYGYLSEEIAAEWLRAIDAGEIDLPRYRGNIYLTSKQQVAEIAILQWLRAKKLLGASITIAAEQEASVKFKFTLKDGIRYTGEVFLDEISISYYSNCSAVAEEKASVKQGWIAKDVKFNDE